MVTVETTHADLRLALLGLVELLLDAGAWVHPQLRIVERERQISVWTDGDDPWLMRIPRDSLVPVANVAWSEKPPLQSTAVPNSFTPLQRAVLEACTAVMVAAGTWEHFHATHPRATITDPNAIEMIRSLHPPFLSLIHI